LIPVAERLLPQEDLRGGVVDQGWLVFWVIVLALAAGLIYGVACFIWPYRDCRKCKGGGKFRSPSGKAWRRCRRCKGSGSRVRLGRRVWTKAGIAKNKLVG
jgi:hypothetical protein